ncbi:unnamed protein product [Prorocentrum cordatum]|uniref:Uncharacterized protein n=1 Tax=Prorocentrum cordatum TaxID=2364126 RepID=A0ABN9PAP8_9DINO|nr:unnamed protein product [Polarella glacialis]
MGQATQALDVDLQEFKGRIKAIKDRGWHAARRLALALVDAEPSAASRRVEMAAGRGARAELRRQELWSRPLQKKTSFVGLGQGRAGAGPARRATPAPDSPTEPGPQRPAASSGPAFKQLQARHPRLANESSKGYASRTSKLKAEPRAGRPAVKALQSQAAAAAWPGSSTRWRRVAPVARARASSGRSSAQLVRLSQIRGGRLMPGLPAAGPARSMKAINLAAPHVQEWLLIPSCLFKPVAEWPSRVPKGAVQVGSDEVWCAIGEHPVNLGICKPIVEEGIFSYDGELRLQGPDCVTQVTQLFFNMAPQNECQRIAETDLVSPAPSSSWTVTVLGEEQAHLWSSCNQSGAPHLRGLPAALRRLRQREAHRNAGVPWAENKAAGRVGRVVSMWALVDSTAGRMANTIDNLIDIGRTARWLLETAWVTHKACLMILGRLARAFVFGRPLFATLNQVWIAPGLGAASESEGKALAEPLKLPSGARAELLSAISLLPLTFTDIRAPFDSFALAPDASEEGGGLCYLTGPIEYGVAVVAKHVGEEAPALTPRGAMVAQLPPMLLMESCPLPAVALFDLFCSVGAAWAALPRCPRRVAARASSVIDEAAKRREWQRWPGVVELEDINKLSSQGQAESSLRFEGPRAIEAVKLALCARQTRQLVEAVAGVNAEDSLPISRQPGAKPCRVEAMYGSLARMPRFCWLSCAPQPRTGVIDVTGEVRCHKVKLHVAPREFPAWAEDGWGGLGPSHALHTAAKLRKQASPPAPGADIRGGSEAAIARGAETRCVSPSYYFEDQLLLWKHLAHCVVAHVLAQLLVQEIQQGGPPILPFLIAGAAPESWGHAPDFESTGALDTDLAQQLVLEYLGALVRSGLRSNLWTRSIGHGHPWREDARLKELEVGAAVNAIKWMSRTAARFRFWHLHLLGSQVAASVRAKGRCSARRRWHWMRGPAADLLASGKYPMCAPIDADENPAQPFGDARLARVTRERYMLAARRLLVFWVQQAAYECVAACIKHVWREGGSLLEVVSGLAAVACVAPPLSGKPKLGCKLQKTRLWLGPTRQKWGPWKGSVVLVCTLVAGRLVLKDCLAPKRP